MDIKCHDLESLAVVCAELVCQGVTFEAKTLTLTIHLLGGY